MEWCVWSANTNETGRENQTARQQDELANSHLSELFKPFRDTKPNGESRVFWQNLVSSDAPSASAVGLINVTDEIREMVSVLDLRGYAVADGHVVLSSSQKKLAESYAQYLESKGLVSENSINNTIFVDNPTEYEMVMKHLAELALQRGAKVEVVPYFQSGKLFDLAETEGVSIYGSGREVAHEVVDSIYNKANYRDVIEGLAGPLPYPRLTIRSGQEIGMREEFLLQRALDYVQEYNQAPPVKALFLQAVSSGGGFGNAIVYQEADGRLRYQSASGEDYSFANPRDFLRHARDLGFDNDLTPFVKVTRSYSFGIICCDSGITVFGPRHQVLDEKNNFMGWKINKNEPEESVAPVREQMEVARKFGIELWRAGYRGCLSEDLFEFESPNDGIKTGRAESNVRRDATTLLTGLLLSREKSREALLAGELSIRQSDHFPISARHQITDVESLVTQIEKAGLPLLSADNPRGVVLVSPPVLNRTTGKAFAVLGVVGRDDADRDELYRKMEVALSE